MDERIELSIKIAKIAMRRSIDMKAIDKFSTITSALNNLEKKFRCNSISSDQYDVLVTASDYCNSLLMISGIEHVDYFISQSQSVIGWSAIFVLHCVDYKSDFLIAELIYDINEFVELRKPLVYRHDILISAIKNDDLTLHLRLSQF